MSEIELTKEELSAISALKRLGQKWPKSLWIYSGDGGAYILKTLPNGEHAVLPDGSMDQSYIVGSIPHKIPIDGGTW